MKPDNILANLPADLTDEVFENLIQHPSVMVERIVSRGHTSPASGWYDQERHEWVMVVAGEAVLGFEDGTRVHLRAGDHLNIPAHRRHRVEWTLPDQPTVWLAVHY